ncbi:MAG TPA: DUF2188 domain-containing protein [Nannocystaceae bacterium]|nr:DUF2188 domain-containing protein [Nannocystaceae bacterium]
MPKDSSARAKKAMRIVQPRRGAGGWEVVRPGGKFPGAIADNEETAIARGREIVARTGGGRLVIKSAAGTVVAVELVDRFGNVEPLAHESSDGDR